MADASFATPPPTKKKVIFGAHERDKQEKVTHYRKVCAVSMSLLLQILSMAMGETVAQACGKFNKRIVDIQDTNDLLSRLDARRDPQQPTSS